MLITRQLLGEVLPDEVRRFIARTDLFLRIGSVSPDLPYASIADDDFFFSSASPLADKFHYEATNELPLRALAKLRSEFSKLKSEDHDGLKAHEARAAFFIGYALHVIGDGVIHPFVQDKVGVYEENKREHRAFEMALDVLVHHHLTKESGEFTEHNYSNLHRVLADALEDSRVPLVAEDFADHIRSVYQYEVSGDEIQQWIKGLHRMFAIAEGRHPKIYRDLDFTDGIVFKNAADLLPHVDKFLVLERPKHWADNFLKRPRISFLEDCLPRFYQQGGEFLLKAYASIYENGPELSASDLPEINLDTGRALAAGNDLDFVPIYWS